MHTFVEYGNLGTIFTFLHPSPLPPPPPQGDVWICMELLDSSMDKIADKVYNQLHQTIPEPILGKMTVAVCYFFFVM